jgi:hypothetical protein
MAELSGRVAALEHRVGAMERPPIVAPEPEAVPPSSSKAKVLVLTYACFGRGAGGCQPRAAASLQAAVDSQLNAPQGRRLVGTYEGAPEWMATSLRSKAAYARRHGYAFALAGNESYVRAAPRPRSWGVLRALQKAVSGGFAPCDWVWCVPRHAFAPPR